MSEDTTLADGGAGDATLLLGLEGLAVTSVELAEAGTRLVRVATADETAAAACPSCGVVPPPAYIRRACADERSRLPAPPGISPVSSQCNRLTIGTAARPTRPEPAQQPHHLQFLILSGQPAQAALYIEDGHHRWAKARRDGRQFIIGGCSSSAASAAHSSSASWTWSSDKRTIRRHLR